MIIPCIYGWANLLNWLVVWNMCLFLSVYWECHHPKWLILFRGVETTNQHWYVYLSMYVNLLIYLSIYQYINQFIGLNLFICLIYLSIDLSIYLIVLNYILPIRSTCCYLYVMYVYVYIYVYIYSCVVIWSLWCTCLRWMNILWILVDRND